MADYVRTQRSAPNTVRGNRNPRNSSKSGVVLPAVVSEPEAYSLYRNVLEDKELRRARQRGDIGFLRCKGRFLYLRDELDA